MKFNKGDKVRVIKPYEGWLEVGQVYTIVNNPTVTINVHTKQRGVGGFLISDGHFERAVPAFDSYFVYSGSHLVANYSTFDEADTRARGLAEGGKIATVMGATTDKLIATYQRPVPPVEVIFADQT